MNKKDRRRRAIESQINIMSLAGDRRPLEYELIPTAAVSRRLL
jgi:hypothetical protein